MLGTSCSSLCECAYRSVFMPLISFDIYACAIAIYAPRKDNKLKTYLNFNVYQVFCNKATLLFISFFPQSP